MKIGILALQGGFAKHCAVIEALGGEAVEVRTERELSSCHGLIIPGGESTVLTKLLMDPSWEAGTEAKPSALYNGIARFAKERPIMGTCAGLIMMSSDSQDPRVVPFGILPLTVRRNGYGRQTESFIEALSLGSGFPEHDKKYRATFIRAPRIQQIGEGVEILTEAEGHGTREPVMVRSRNALALSFHPELTPEDTRIHAYFISMAK